MSTRAVRDIIRKLRAEGRCVLFSSHVMQEVSALCDPIVVVAGGRVVAHGTPDELRAQGGHENLEDAFVALAGTATGEPAMSVRTALAAGRGGAGEGIRGLVPRQARAGVGAADHR